MRLLGQNLTSSKNIRIGTTFSLFNTSKRLIKNINTRIFLDPAPMIIYNWEITLNVDE